jgi:Arc/MetJ family transcription regulator
MRTTLNIDEKSLSTAARLTGVHKKTELVRMGLEALIAREAARKLAALGGSDRKARMPRRRRPG